MDGTEESVLASWRRFVEGQPPDGPLTDAIVESWTRCRSFGIDTEQTLPWRIPLAELEERLAASRSLLAVAPAHMAWAADALAGVDPFVVILTDADGVVLHSIGSDPEITAAFGLTPGHQWSEERMGTNGIGTALAARKPVAVVGAEHYSRAWHNNTCVGAPIVGADGRTLGAVDLSVAAKDGDPSRLVLAAFLADVIAREVARDEARAPFATSELIDESSRRPGLSGIERERLGRLLARRAAELGELRSALVEAARLPARGVEPLGEVDLLELARGVAARAGARAPAIAVRGEGVLGRWDEARLGQALEQLLAVAQRSGGAPPELEIAADATEARIAVLHPTLAVSRGGRERVLAPLDPGAPAEREQPGVVLALWIVRQIVDAMGGRVELSDAGGGGSVAIVLPRR